MKFGKKREKGTESAMWKYAKYAVVAVCVIGIGANSVSVIPTGYTGVKSTFGKISEKELTTGIHISVPFVQHIQTISNKQQDRRCEGKIWGETSDKTPVYGENVTVTYSISPEKSAWLCANVTDTENLIKGSMVASAMKAAMAELAPEDVTNRGKIEPLTQKKLEEVLNTKYGKDAITLYQVIIENMGGSGGGFNLAGKIKASGFVQKKKEEHKTGTIKSDPVVKLPTAEQIALTPQKTEKLSQIIAEINSKTGKSYDNDVAVKAMLQIKDIMMKSEELKASAKNNTEKDFEFAYFDNIDDALIEGLNQNQDFFSLLLGNDEIKKEVLGIFAEEIYRGLRAGE